ncbi:MAG: SRPBCC domain-containing protein [Chthoniobacterales bacterium]
MRLILPHEVGDRLATHLSPLYFLCILHSSCFQGICLFGVYSIVKFELVEQGGETKIVFDHTGFPKGDAESFASGWKAHYWDPLQKFLINT